MGTRNSYQRTRILEYLKSIKTHPTAEKVYAAVRKDIPTISLGTVYRNLNKMADGHEIHRLEVCGEYHFDADMAYHQHCVCKKCGRILDFFDEEISKCAIKRLGRGFDAECVHIIFHGICKDCKKTGPKGGKNGKN